MSTTEAYTLLYPIERDGADPIRTLMMRRPRLRDIEAMNRAIAASGARVDDLIAATNAASMGAEGAVSPAKADETNGAMAGAIALVASMNGLAPADLMDMDAEDFALMQGVLANFTRAGQPAAAGR